jgi:hypothetical protein
MAATAASIAPGAISIAATAASSNGRARRVTA